MTGNVTWMIGGNSQNATRWKGARLHRIHSHGTSDDVLRTQISGVHGYYAKGRRTLTLKYTKHN
jgi:hypothetical protein